MGETDEQKRVVFVSVIWKQYLSWRNQMKSVVISFIFLLGIYSLFPALALPDEWKSAQAELENVDAFKALTIANQWKWSKKGIKSYVDSREVVFRFPDGKVKRVPLPEDKMMVAVAPYIKRTHK